MWDQPTCLNEDPLGIIDVACEKRKFGLLSALDRGIASVAYVSHLKCAIEIQLLKDI